MESVHTLSVDSILQRSLNISSRNLISVDVPLTVAFMSLVISFMADTRKKIIIN